VRSKADRPEMTPLDPTDVDKYVGVPLGGEQPKHPFTTNDIRRFVQGLDNPHRLLWDDAYAEKSPFGSPPSTPPCCRSCWRASTG
jgi:hypothetical protein